MSDAESDYGWGEREDFDEEPVDYCVRCDRDLYPHDDIFEDAEGSVCIDCHENAIDYWHEHVKEARYDARS